MTVRKLAGNMVYDAGVSASEVEYAPAAGAHSEPATPDRRGLLRGLCVETTLNLENLRGPKHRPLEGTADYMLGTSTRAPRSNEHMQVCSRCRYGPSTQETC